STLTMQLARLIYHLNTRTPAGKVKQAGLALWLEARYSRSELLEAYLNIAPFGGNIQGVGAGSRIYFDKPTDRLTLAEALTLAVIPQHPAARAGHLLSDSNLLAARAQLAKTWLAQGSSTEEERLQAETPITIETEGASRKFALPFRAPHFVDA